MEEKIFELGDYSFLKKSKVQMSTLIKATIFYIVSGIVTAFIVFFGVIALFFKSAIPISVGEFFIYIIPISVFLFFGYQCFRLWQRHFQIINSPNKLIVNDYEIAIDENKFVYKNIKVIKMTHPKSLKGWRKIQVFFIFFYKKRLLTKLLGNFFTYTKNMSGKRNKIYCRRKCIKNPLTNK